MNEYLSIYGGPFLHFISGTFHHKEYSSIVGLVSEHSDGVTAPSWFGGYIGAQLNVLPSLPVNLEWQHTAFADALSALLIWRR